MAGGISISGFASGVGGAVNELFAADASAAKADMFRTQARLDLLQGDAARLRGEGARLEGERFARAGELSVLNKEFTAQSTAIQIAQAERAITLGLGDIRSTVAGSGLTMEGSAEDVLSASARQGALERQILAQQGVITEEGYQEQFDVYQKMVDASRVAERTAGIGIEAAELSSQMHLQAAEAEDKAQEGHGIAAIIKGVAGVASLFGV